MGTTIWVLGKSSMSEGDDWDHTAIFEAVEKLDAVCASSGVPALSTFLDWTDFNANMSDEEEFPADDEMREGANWFDPDAALRVLRVVRDYAAENKSVLSELYEPGSEHLSECLLDELDDCIGKVEKIRDSGDQFHLCVVM
jgi:hypothetical protein